MLEVRNLTKRYGDITAVRDVSFTAAQGQILGFLGPNGAGKTTTMRILTGYLPATSGTAKVAGFDVFTESEEVRRRIGYLPENPPLYADMTTDAYLRFVARIKGDAEGGDRRRDRARRAHLRSRQRCATGCSAISRKGSGSASGSRKRSSTIRRCWCSTSRRSVSTRGRSSRSAPSSASSRAQRTVILSTHILPEVSQICEKVVIINEGQVVLEEDMATLTRDASLEDVFLRSIAKEPARGGAAGVRNILTIAGREIRSYFVSPIAYVVLTGFLLLGGWFFFNLLARFNFLLDDLLGAAAEPAGPRAAELERVRDRAVAAQSLGRARDPGAGDHDAEPRRGEEGRHLRAAAHLAAQDLGDRPREVPRRAGLRRSDGRC